MIHNHFFANNQKTQVAYSLVLALSMSFVGVTDWATAVLAATNDIDKANARE